VPKGSVKVKKLNVFAPFAHSSNKTCCIKHFLQKPCGCTHMAISYLGASEDPSYLLLLSRLWFYTCWVRGWLKDHQVQRQPQGLNEPACQACRSSHHFLTLHFIHFVPPPSVHRLSTPLNSSTTILLVHTPLLHFCPPHIELVHDN
jgi:hypothetical protein